jgi:hypothetical protein
MRVIFGFNVYMPLMFRACSLMTIVTALNADARLGEIFEVAKCEVLKNVFEDPIVSPGARSAHMHTVFGAETFSDVVTEADLQPTVSSTCDLKMDRSMYWIL